jgi:predicted phage tail protein
MTLKALHALLTPRFKAVLECLAGLLFIAGAATHAADGFSPYLAVAGATFFAAGAQGYLSPAQQGQIAQAVEDLAEKE